MTGLGEGSESFRGSTSGSGGLGFFLIGFGLEDYNFKRISNLQVTGGGGFVSLDLGFLKGSNNWLGQQLWRLLLYYLLFLNFHPFDFCSLQIGYSSEVLLVLIF